jgi:DNA polymerase III delta prime subunit
MREQCQNALLKFIEEPFEFNCFILTAKSTEKILPTILSRVVTLPADNNSEYSEENGVSEYSETTVETVKSIISALAVKSEYKTAAAFSLIKDRQSLSEVLKLMLSAMKDAAACSSGFYGFNSVCRREVSELSQVLSCNAAGFIKAADIISEHLKRREVNPNLPLTASVCAFEIYKCLTNNEQLTIDN